MSNVVELSAKQLTDEETRANTFCANPTCWRRLCHDYHCSMHFCCGVCETNYATGFKAAGQAHGPACSKKEKPPEDAPRLALPRDSAPPGNAPKPPLPDGATAAATSTRARQRVARAPRREERTSQTARQEEVERAVGKKREREKAGPPVKRRRSVPTRPDSNSARPAVVRKRPAVAAVAGDRVRECRMRGTVAVACSSSSAPRAAKEEQQEPDKEEFSLPMHTEQFKTRELLVWLLRDLHVSSDYVEVHVNQPWGRMDNVEQLQHVIGNVRELIYMPRNVAMSLPCSKREAQLKIIRRIESLCEDLQHHVDGITQGSVGEEEHDALSHDGNDADAVSQGSGMPIDTVAVKEQPPDDEDDITGREGCDMREFCKGKPTDRLHEDNQGRWCSTCLPCVHVNLDEL